jgi:hypothetical protein
VHGENPLGLVDARHDAILDDASGYAIFQERNIEIDQQTGAEAAHSYVAHQLSFVDGHGLRNGLYLDNYFLRYNDIHPIAAVEIYALVLERQFDLPLELDATQMQFVAETSFVG